MKFKRRAKFNMKRTFSIIFLFLVMIGITFGYAFLTTKLEVNGSLEVSSSSWDIHFANIVTESGSVTPTTEPAVSNKTTINFSVELEKATDFYGFTADIVNDGTYDAKLDSIEILPELTTDQQEYFSYAVTYSDGVEIKKDDALDSGTSENIKVRFEYKENVDTSKYPEEDVEFNFTVTMNYVQGKGNAVDHIESPVSFADDSWATVVAAIKAGNTSAYHLGDTKEVDMGTFGTHTIRIANTTTPSECNTTGFSQTACGFVLEFADIITRHRMNPYTDGDANLDGSTVNGTGNKGGWEYSDMRAFLNSTIYAKENIDYSTTGIYSSLPEVLRNAIIDTRVVSGHGSVDTTNYTTTDKLYLLSRREVWNYTGTYDTASEQTRQMDYYASQNVTTSSYAAAIKKDSSGTASYWWLRSANSYYTYCFNRVTITGYTYSNNSDITSGVAPAFRIA